MRAFTLSLAGLLVLTFGSMTQAAVLVHAGPVHLRVGRAAPRPVVRPVVRARRSYVRNEVHENRVDAWNELLEAVSN
jgi:hypothetical protein